MTKIEFIEKYGEAAYQKKLANTQNWRKSHKEHAAELSRAWIAQHRDRKKEHDRIWRKQHPFYNKNINRSRPYMNRYRLAHQQCECCFNPTDEIHHIIPIPSDRLLDFGDSLLTDENLMAVCASCHDKLHAEMKKGAK